MIASRIRSKRRKFVPYVQEIGDRVRIEDAILRIRQSTNGCTELAVCIGDKCRVVARKCPPQG